MPNDAEAVVRNLRLEIERSLGQGPVTVSIEDLFVILEALERVTGKRDAARLLIDSLMIWAPKDSSAMALLRKTQRDYPDLFYPRPLKDGE